MLEKIAVSKTKLQVLEIPVPVYFFIIVKLFFFLIVYYNGNIMVILF